MSDQEKLKMQIHQYDFALIELNLYLDTHPYDSRALDRFKALVGRRNALVKAYEERFGSYIVCPADGVQDGRWKWINSPWPWENSEATI